MNSRERSRHLVGIDLGTTRTAIAHVIDGEPELIPNAIGNDLTPSVVHITESGEAVAGDPAKDQLVLYPDRTVAEIKREIGKEITIPLGERSYRPEEISALLLKKVVGDAEERLKHQITRAVITVPAYFTGRERTATQNAGELAELSVEHLLPEPSAAVLAYAHQQRKLGASIDETVFVYDLGGGTFDATIVEAEYEHNYVETVLTDGASDLGGADWTAAIEEWIISEIEAETGVNIAHKNESNDQRKRITIAADEAKRELSQSHETVITIPYILPERNYTFERRIDRETFETLTEELLTDTQQIVYNVLTTAGYGCADIDTVLLIGGASRMPQIEDFLHSYFGQPVSKQVSPDRAVAMGAAVHASVLTDDGSEFEKSLSSTHVAEDDRSTTDSLVLVDVLPQTLGVELVDDEFSAIIEKGTQIPTTVGKETFRTISPDQTAVEWPIRQGDSTQASDNDLLGTLIIRDIPPRDPEEDSISIEFTMKSDGTLDVEITDLITGKVIDGEIESGIRLSSDDLDRMTEQLPDAK